MELLKLRLPILLATHKLKLIIIDSITAPFRVAFESWEMPSRAKKLSKVGSLLHKMCNSYNCSVVCVNQVSVFVITL